MKVVFVILGYANLLLAIIGTFLPIMPTVPFLILAAYCFQKGSPRLHRWLLRHPKIGPPLKEWEKNKVIRPRIKIIATLGILSGGTYITIISKIPTAAKVCILVILALVLIYIWTRPSKPFASSRKR